MKKDLKKVNNLIKTLKSNKEKYQAFLSGDVLKKINEVFKNINELEEAKFEEAINSNLMAEKGEMASIVLKETLQYLVDIKVATTAKPEKPPKKLLSLRADYIRKGKREGALIPINDDFEDNTFLTNIDNLNDAYNKIVEECYNIAKYSHNSKDCVRYMLKTVGNKK